MDTAVGPLLLAATEEGLVRVAYGRQDHDTVLAQLADRVSPRVLRAPARLDPAARPVDEYFARRRRSFHIALDFRLSHRFSRAVLTHLIEIGYGETASYAAVAGAAGNPKAVRAAATACATNPGPVARHIPRRSGPSELSPVPRGEDDLGDQVRAQPELVRDLVGPHSLLVVQQREPLLRLAPRPAGHLAGRCLTAWWCLMTAWCRPVVGLDRPTGGLRRGPGAARHLGAGRW